MYVAVGVLATEGGEEHNPLLPETSELIFGLIAFLLLFFLLRKFAFPAFERAYARRRELIEGGIERAERSQAEAQRALEQYRAQLADARQEAGRIREEAHTAARQLEQEARARAQEEYERIVARGEEQLAAERQQIVTQLRGEIGALAVGLAERIIGESLGDQAMQRRVVDRFLDDLETDVAPAGERR